MQTIDVAIAVVKKDGKILICQRKKGDSLGGFWEFPGGKREAGETLDSCLRRELMEEVGIRVNVLGELEPFEHHYPHTRVMLYPFLCEHVDGEAKALASQRVAWVKVAEFRNFKFPPANDSLLKEIGERIGAE